MCTTRRQAARVAALSGEKAAAACMPDVVLERAAHDAAYEGGDAHDVGPATRLPLRALATDPAVLIFAVLHLAALATPLVFRGFSRADAALVAASYAARMFGAFRGAWHAAAEEGDGVLVPPTARPHALTPLLRRRGQE